MVKLKYILGIFMIVFLSCSGQENKTINHTDSDSIRKQRIVRYYEDSSVKGSRQQFFVKNLGKLMGLPAISNGKGGLYVRIWLWDFGEKYVINISDDHLTKECNITEFAGMDTDSGSVIVIHKVWTNLKPKSGWQNFFDSLKKFQIPDLESGKVDKKRTERLTHMSYVQFEIVRPDQYRYYEYLEPSFYRYVDTGSNNVYRFLEFFNNEMNVQVYSPAKKLFIKSSVIN